MTTETTSEPQTLMSRIAGIWTKKQEDAKAVYARLLKRAELDGKQLTDAEAAALAAAMQDAKITLEKAEQHRELCEKIRVYRPIAAGLAEAKVVAARAQSDLETLATELADVQQRHQAAHDAHAESKSLVTRAEDAQWRLTDSIEFLKSEIGITV